MALVSGTLWIASFLGILLLATRSSWANPLGDRDSSCSQVRDIDQLLRRIHGLQFCKDFLSASKPRISTTTSTIVTVSTRTRGVSTETVTLFTQRLATTTYYTTVPTQTVTISRFTATEIYTLPRPITTVGEPEKRQDSTSESATEPFLVIKDPIGFPLAPPYFDIVVDRSFMQARPEVSPRNELSRRKEGSSTNIPPLLESYALAEIATACSCLYSPTSNPVSTKTIVVTSTSISRVPSKTTTQTVTSPGQPATLALHAYRGSTTTTQTLSPTVRYIEPLPASIIAADCQFFLDNTGSVPDPYAYEANGANSGIGYGNRIDIYEENIYVAQTCCQTCFQLKNCVASAYIIGTCQLLINDADTNADGTTDEVKTGRCPLGVEDYGFGARGQGGFAYPGPCGY